MTMRRSTANQQLRLNIRNLGIAFPEMGMLRQVALPFLGDGGQNQGIGGTEYNDASHDPDNPCPHPSMRRISQMTADHEKQLSLHSATSFL
jgi:hypothetical protein